ARGRVIVHPDAEMVAAFADLSASPPVAALLADDAPSGSATYSAPDGERLVGYASLASLRWGVVVERPTTVALASVRSARELAFAMLLLFVSIAVLVAVF